MSKAASCWWGMSNNKSEWRGNVGPRLFIGVKFIHTHYCRSGGNRKQFITADSGRKKEVLFLKSDWKLQRRPSTFRPVNDGIQSTRPSLLPTPRRFAVSEWWLIHFTDENSKFKSITWRKRNAEVETSQAQIRTWQHTDWFVAEHQFVNSISGITSGKHPRTSLSP